MDKLFVQPVKNDLRTYDSFQKIAIGQGDDLTTGCLLDYNCFKNYYKMIVINLCKQQALDADPKVIQKINFLGNLYRGGNVNDNTVMFFIIEEAKKHFRFFTRNCESIVIYFVLI